MPPKKEEMTEQMFHRLEEAAKTLTQDQIDACAWVMGGSGAGWNKLWILQNLEIDKKRLTISNK